MMPLTEDIRKKGRARSGDQCIHLPYSFPQRGRASQPEEDLAYASEPACLSGLSGEELGVPVPASPPPSPSWLQEQRAPLSRLSLENSASRSPAPAHMSPLLLSMSLVKDGWSRNSTLIPSTEATSSPARRGLGGSPYFPTTPARFWSSNFVSSFILDLKTRSRSNILAILVVSSGKRIALVTALPQIIPETTETKEEEERFRPTSLSTC